MSLLPVGFGASGDDAYEITDSLRFRSSASAYLSRTPATAGNRKTWTLSWWAKRGLLGSTGFTVFSAGTGTSGDTGELVIKYDNNYPDSLAIQTTNTNIRFTNALYRDPSAWHHVVVAFDTTQATAANRHKVYVNGEQVTSFNISNNLAQNTDTAVNNTVTHEIGVFARINTQYFDGYLTEVQMIDGQQLTADDFGEYDANGTWKAKEYTGTYGNNGFYLPMKPTTQAELQNTVLYAGTGATQSIDGCGYAPDLVWTKSRNHGQNHELYDSVRGPQKYLLADTTVAEGTVANGLASFDTDGFSVGSSSGSAVNISGQSLVAWGWDAGDNQPSTGHSSILYKGSGGAISLKGFGFSPDLVWIKNRDGTAQNQMLFDSVRGPNLRLQSDTTASEYDQTNSLISFDTDGFSFGTSTGNLNSTSSNYVAWGWDAGDGDPVSNTTGDINSTVKANDATGFSIVSYTGDGSASSTVGHGLGSSASMIIVKDRAVANNWRVWHKDLSANHWMYLNLTNAEASGATDGGIRNVDANTFGFINGTTAGVEAVNTNNRAYIAYCFSEVSGVSKFDSYEGNGSTTGPVITTGFRPGFVMIKSSTNSGTDWLILDSTRSPFNTVNKVLFANSSSAEAGTGYGDMDVSDTGFQIKTNGASSNASGQTYIYMAFKGSYSDHVSPLNDDGSIDSRVKANPDKGFSIVSWEGSSATTTVGHGLSTAPKVIIAKNRDASGTEWPVYHDSVNSGGGSYLRLNGTYANTSSSIIWTGSPTSSVINVGSYSYVNSNSMIAYCFSEVAGYSKIDKYTGTGSAGLSVTTGFRPAFVMTKRTDSTSNWNISDSRRSPTGTANTTALRANTTDTENTVGTAYVKFTDTGFEITGTSTETNANGGTYIYMAFADTADARFNFDASGNKNNFDANNINSNAESETTYDLMKDTPSLVDENAANFATLNPLDVYPGRQFALDGNLKWNDTSGGSWGRSTMSVTTGKWYWEVSGFSTNNWMIGVSDGTKSITNSYAYYAGAPTALVYLFNGTTYIAGANAAFTSAFATTDVVGFVVDADAGSLAVYKNNVLQGTITGLSYGSYSPMVGPPAAGSCVFNFGQRPLTYTPPTGSKKFNTFNLPDSTIEKGSDYFNTVLYTGNGSTQAITGVGFQPNLTWFKSRSVGYDHQLHDVLRSPGVALLSNSSQAEFNYGTVSSFDSDGFTVDATSYIGTNASGATFVSWNWKANGSGSSNTSGDVNSTVSVDTTAGFSIATATTVSSYGSFPFTIGHGLGTAPAMVIYKSRTTAGQNWWVWHKDLPNAATGRGILLNSSGAEVNGGYFASNPATATTMGINAAALINDSAVMYSFAEVEGYSKFGSYTGNGSTDGTFVYTGFRPALVIIKETTSTGSWVMLDTTRSTYNVINNDSLWANLADAEGGSASYFDMLSNGFKIRDTDSDKNTSGQSYIYMAFAENPFKNSNAR